MKTRIPSIIRLILFASVLTLVPYALVPHAGTALGYLDNGATVWACPVKSVSVTPNSQPIEPGGTTSYQVTVSLYPQYKFKGLIVISLTGLPSGVSCPAIEISDSDGDLTAVGTLSIDSTCNVTPGTYSPGLSVIARYPNPDSIDRYNGNPKNVELIVNPPTADFKLSGSSQSPSSIVQGESAEFDVSGDFIGCFTGPVSLSVDRSTLPVGVTDWSFSPDTITAESSASTLTLNTTADTPAGEYDITVRGVSGDLSNDTVVTLIVTEPAPCFSVDVHPENRNIKAGEEGENDFFTVVTNWCEGYTGDVTLSVDGLPDGVTYKFDDNPVSPNGNSDNGNAQTKLRIYSECYTPPGEYTIKVIGTPAGTPSAKMVSVEPPSGTATLTVTEGDGGFKLTTGSQAPAKIYPGESAEFSITGNFAGCFAGPVYLSVDKSTLPVGVTIESFEPGTINTDGGTSILTLKTSINTLAGTHKITVKGVSGDLADDTVVTLVVEKPFYLSADSQEPPKIEPGETAKFKIHAHDFTDPVYFSIDGALPPGVKDASLDPPVLPITGATNWVTLSVQTDTTIKEGTYNITVKGVCGGQSDKVVVTLVVEKPQDFTLSAKPTDQEIKVGDKADFAVIGEFTEGFTGEVKLSLKDTPFGLSGSFVPESISPKDIDSVLTITTGADTKPGTYEFTIIGTHETLGTRTAAVKLTVTDRPQDFSLSAEPTSRDINAGDKADFKVIGSFSEGFEGEVELSADIAPSGPSGYLSPKLISAGSPNSELTVSTGYDTEPGTYEITITGTHKTLGTRTTKATLTVTKPSNFTLSANPTSRDIEPGGTATYTITVNDGGSLPPYTVSFPEPSVTDGLTATIDPMSLPPTSNTNSVTLTVQTDSTVEEGIYNITVEASGGGHTANVTVTLTINEAPVVETAGLTVDKSVSPSSAKVGGMLLYTVEISNTGRGPLKDVVVRDHMPAGVGYVKGSTTIDGRKATEPSGTTTLIWEIDEIDGGDSVTLKYHGVVKPNISRGKSTNTVTIIGTDATGRTLTARASADLGVSSEALDRKGKIKGKVFVDENGNGLKNVDEEGIAGVWIIMESGERTSTDEEGMFQFDEVDSGQHLVAVDVRKLSKEYFVAGDSSKIVSLFSGGTGRTYFGLGRTGPTKEELEVLKKAEEEKAKKEEEVKKEEEARKEEEKKKVEEEKEKNAPKGTLFGNVFVDANDNNIYNPGEKRLEKVTVLLDATKRAVTDKVGNYRFDKVKEGRHTLSIREDQEFKKGYRLSKKEKITVNVKASTNNRKDIPVLDKSKLKINIELTVR